MSSAPSLLNQTGPPDEEGGLVRRLKCREQAAFDELLERYQGPIYGFVYRLLEDSADAPDVTQDIFIKIFRKIGEFRCECTLKTWIYRIAIREASNRRRWFSRHRRNMFSIDGADDDGGAWDWIRDEGATPFESLSSREHRDLVEEALKDVDERLRCAVIMRDIQGLAYTEIAEALQISLGTVKSRILRGREALKQNVQRRLAGEALPDALQPE